MFEKDGKAGYLGFSEEYNLSYTVNLRGGSNNRSTGLLLHKNLYKVNVDAAVSVERNSTGIGIVIHNWRGEFMTGKCFLCSAAQIHTEKELLAAREGCHFHGKWTSKTSIIPFEGGARNVVDYIKENKCDLPYNGYVIRYGFLYAP